MTCRLCHSNKRLIDAHIIPRAFYEASKNSRAEPLYLISTKPNEYIKKSPIGPYDPNILCAKCDSDLNLFDNYAVSLIRQISPQEHGIFNKAGRCIAYIVPTYDYHKFKLFLLAMLWRASVSKHEHFRRINLGIKESVIREILLNRAPGPPDQYATFMSFFMDVNPAFTMLDPAPSKINDRNYYTFYLHSFSTHINMDDKPDNELAKALIIAPKMPLCIIGREIHDTAAQRIIERAFKRISES